MERLLLLLLLLLSSLVPLCYCVDNPNCTSSTDCSCTFANGTGIYLADFKSKKGDAFIESTGAPDGNTYRFYPCGAVTAWDPNGDCVAGVAACQHSVSEDLYYSIGRVDMFSIEEAVLDGESSYVKFVYTGGSPADAGKRECSITVVCSEEEQLTFQGEDPQLEYNLEFRTKRGCPVHGAPAGGNAPALFIIVILVLFLAIVTYVVVGMMLMVFWKKARGFEIIPNWSFWKDLPFLLKDGFLFTFSCIPAVRARIGGQEPYSSLK